MEHNIFISYFDTIRFTNGRERVLKWDMLDNNEDENRCSPWQDLVEFVENAFPELQGKCILQTMDNDVNYEIRSDRDFDLLRKQLSYKDVYLKVVTVTRPVLMDRKRLRKETGSMRDSHLFLDDDLVDDDAQTDENDQEDNSDSDLSLLGKLRHIIPNDRSKLTVSHLEDQLSAYRISWGRWKREKGNKTIEDLFDELRHGVCDLYADSQGALRVVRLVRVYIRHPETGMVLVNAKKMVVGKSKMEDVNALPAYKCNFGEAPYHAALRNLQKELGFSLWGPVDGIEPENSMRTFEFDFTPSMRNLRDLSASKTASILTNSHNHQKRRGSMFGEGILQVIKPTGFDRPTHEFRNSKSFPGLRTTYYINTLVVDMSFPGVPKQGSFTTTDRDQEEVTRLWQWLPVEVVNAKILKTSSDKKTNNNDATKSTDHNKTLEKKCPLANQQHHLNERSVSLVTMQNEAAAAQMGQPKHDAAPMRDPEKKPSWMNFRKNAELYRKRLMESDHPAPTSLYSRFVHYWNHNATVQRGKQDQVELKNQQATMNLPTRLDLITEPFLRRWLTLHGVDTSRWGTGQAKRVDQLVDELHKGETELVLVENAQQSTRANHHHHHYKSKRKIYTSSRNAAIPTAREMPSASGMKALRIIRVAKVELLHPTNDGLVLVETHQKLADSRIRVRFKTLSEKFKPGETPWDAALRGITEEMFEPDIYTVDPDTKKQLIFKRASVEVMRRNVRIVSMHSPVVEVTNSPSYPGLETRYILHRFSCVVEGLPEEAFCTDEQDKKGGYVTHFWRWETKAHINAMTNSLIKQVRFYQGLVSPSEQDMEVMTDWLFDAAKSNQVDVINLLCGSGSALIGNDNILQIKDNKKPTIKEDLSPTSPYGGVILPKQEDMVHLDPSKIVDKQNRTPLRVAALNNAHEAVDALIRIQLLNATKKAQDTVNGVRNLENEEGNERQPSAFDIMNQQDAYNCTLFYYAAIANRVELIETLLSSKNVSVNSVCLHSCISRGAVDVLPIILPRLRFESMSKEPRIIFGVEREQFTEMDDEERQRYIAPPPRADNFSYFKSLLDHIEYELNTVSATEKAISKSNPNFPVATNAHGRIQQQQQQQGAGSAKDNNMINQVYVSKILKALEIVLQFCNPTAYYYKSFLRIYLHKVIELDDREHETIIFAEFIQKSRFPLHIALISAHVLRSIIGLEKRFWDSYQFHAEKFQELVCEILDCCEDQAEAEELLRERADIPSWRAEDGSLVTRPYAHRHKSTCSYLAVKYRLKKVVAHKFFTTQNDGIWFNDEQDSLYTRGLGSINHLSATLFQFENGMETVSTTPYELEKKNLGSTKSLSDNMDNNTTTNNNSKQRSAASKRTRIDLDRKTRNESIISFVLRVPGLKAVIQGIYRSMVSVMLVILLILMTPLLWVIPFHLPLRVLVDIPRTEFDCCYYKWSVWSMSYVAYLIAFATLAAVNASDTSRASGPLTHQETILFVFYVANCVGILEQILTIGWGPFCQHSVNLVDTCSATLLTIAFAVRFIEGEQTRMFDMFMSFGSIFSSFRLFHLFSASKNLGPLWITIQCVVFDVARFLALLSVVLVAFILAFVFLLGGHGVQGFETAGDAFSSLIWSVFEPFNTYNPNIEYQTQVFQLFLFVFLLLASILLTNLLIAMMTDRYNAVQQTSRIEWLFALAQLIDKYSNMPILPPPFNLLVAIPNLGFRYFYGRKSLYDPDCFQLDQRQFGVGRRKVTSVVPVGNANNGEALNALESLYVPNSEVNKDEMQALNFRTSRRAVVQRFVQKCLETEARKNEMKDRLSILQQSVENCKELIVSSNHHGLSPRSQQPQTFLDLFRAKKNFLVQ